MRDGSCAPIAPTESNITLHPRRGPAALVPLEWARVIGRERVRELERRGGVVGACGEDGGAVQDTQPGALLVCAGGRLVGHLVEPIILSQQGNTCFQGLWA
jgi:hypothetical protein